MIIFCGDIHGNWESLIREIKRLDLVDCTIIQVGDFGMGFSPRKKDMAALKYINITLKARNITLYAIRGNHDNPEYFNGKISTSNINLIPDYSVLNIDNRKLLCVGGALSIDRKPSNIKTDFNGRPWSGRKEGFNYWTDEAFVLKPELCKDLTDIEIVITHSAPDFCEPRTKSGLSDWAVSDRSLIEDCAKERNDHSKLYDILKENKNPLKYWFYGHFHYYRRERFDDTEFVLLDIDMLYEAR